MTMTDHGSHGSGQSDCPESGSPQGSEHGAGCLASCLSMMGCSSPSFVVEWSLGGINDHARPILAIAAQAHPTRTIEPDRPPPRA